MTDSKDRLRGKVAFVTGAAQGQGRTHVVRLAQQGADVVALDLQDPDGATPFAETVAQVEALGGRILARQCDVRDAARLAAVADEARARFGRIDVVVANAGVISPPKPFLDLPLESLERTMDVNFYGVWHTCRATVPHMIAGGRGGSIVLTSSILGLKAYPNTTYYTASKHAVVGLMKALAIELAPHSIRVNSLHPTTVDTPMLDSLAPPGLTREQNASRLTLLNTLPVPWVDCDDITNAMLFLVGDEARFITGTTLPVDAGAMLK